MYTVHVVVRGKVQGVFYRATAKKVADELGVKGWVKNTADGNVEALVSGTKEKVSNFIEWCKVGPLKAKVIEVEVNELREQHFDSFSVIR